MRLAFFGTPQFAVPSLVKLSASFDVVAVITQPDKPSGRGLRLTVSPVKQKAKELGIKIYQPAELSDFKNVINQIDPDLSVVVAYGKIIPRFVLNHRLGAINAHASLLPLYRGAAPIQRAIMENKEETGITIQKVAFELDAGDILSVKKVAITREDTSGSLHDKLALAAARILVESVENFSELKPVQQDESKVTWAQKILKDDKNIDWNKSNIEIFNQVRALNPAPGAVTDFKGQSLKVWQTSLDNTEGNAGEVIEVSKERFIVACGQGSLNLEIVQASGKNKVKGFEFANNSGIKQGDVIE